MKLQVINPNTTAEMTTAIERAALRTAGDRYGIFCTSPPSGPKAIEAACDTIAAAPMILDELRHGIAAGCAGHVIACFDDPAVAACRELASGPVLGIAEGAMMAASVLGARYGVITTATAGIPIIEDMAERYGLASKLRSVRSCNMAVLDLGKSPAADQRVLVAAQQALADGAEVLVLGCAGMADLSDWLQRETGVPVVEGVAATVGIVSGLVAARLGTSKAGVFAYPEHLEAVQ